MFDALLEGGHIAIHPSEVERVAALTTHLTTEQGVGDLVIADTREQVSTLNSAIRDQHLTGRRGEHCSRGHYRSRRTHRPR